ncbi:hypothetical protein CQ019_11135 [Arthrobacter sp. MYb229]|uniref:DUF6318 family protein n=1 Tax=unclassified Arthrobacter TaxID=235627 RepID=UPI000CFC82FC|nr:MULTISPECIES: DUF6318 family protein [unclassified Arthrobacter]PRA03015.1 hypothetical protein CQ019_11135 [Arthrobacter sp. MYb229]PRB49485.1 hypothetical protein CQ013_12615 [Arthrobacter sp. MYb216]
MLGQKNAQTVVALAMVGALALSGCDSASSDTEAQSSAELSKQPTSESSTIPADHLESPPAQPAKPVKPAALAENTDKGLGAAANYWVELRNYAVATGDTEPFREFSAQDCILCEKLAVQVDDAYASGGRIEGGEFSVVEVSGVTDQFGEEDGAEQVAMAILKLERAAGEVIDSDGKTTRRIEPVSCDEVDSNWDEVAYDQDGEFIGSICSLVASDPEFVDSTGWQPLDVMVNAQ